MSEPGDGRYAFSVRDRKLQKIKVSVGGCPLDVIVDSGARTNIVDQQTWECLKGQKIECRPTKSNRKLYTYASFYPLKVIGTFTTKIVAGNNNTQAEFCIIKGKGETLLGKETTLKLGVLRIGIDIAEVNKKQKTSELRNTTAKIPRSIQRCLQTERP